VTNPLPFLKLKAGDNLYYEDPQTGQWREASLVAVENDSGENTSPNQGEVEFLYTVYDGE
jgi:hypothetical protein